MKSLLKRTMTESLHFVIFPAPPLLPWRSSGRKGSLVAAGGMPMPIARIGLEFHVHPEREAAHAARRKTGKRPLDTRHSGVRPAAHGVRASLPDAAPTHHRSLPRGRHDGHHRAP